MALPATNAVAPSPNVPVVSFKDTMKAAIVDGCIIGAVGGLSYIITIYANLPHTEGVVIISSLAIGARTLLLNLFPTLFQ